MKMFFYPVLTAVLLTAVVAVRIIYGVWKGKNQIIKKYMQDKIDLSNENAEIKKRLSSVLTENLELKVWRDVANGELEKLQDKVKAYQLDLNKVRIRGKLPITLEKNGQKKIAEKKLHHHKSN